MNNSSLTRRKGLDPGCGKKRYEDELAAKLALAGNGFQDSATRHENTEEKQARYHEACGGWHLYPASALPARKPAGRTPRTPARPRKAPRDTGPDAKTRALVLARDGSCCVRCGRNAGPGIGSYSIQHRVARGVGGDNSLPNLITLCGSAVTGCHGKVEARLDPHDLEAGYRLESWQDPATEPVMLHSAHGSGVTVWLLTDGTYGFEAPMGGEAA